MVSRYVEPNPIGSNANVFRQVKTLRDDFGINVDILTWPHNDLWTGPVPTGHAKAPALKTEREGVTYHVFTAPITWNETTNVISATHWTQATAYGVQLLLSLKPDIVHLQHRHGLWWLLDAAQQLRIPTVYSNHDWGIACLRTVLVMGDDSLCDGRLSIVKCADCILKGRGFVGKINEYLVQNVLCRQFVSMLHRTPLKSVLQRHGAVRVPVADRVALNTERAKRVLGKLDALLTPSEFGRHFFLQFGIRPDRIHVLPWYHTAQHTEKQIALNDPFTITYMGRVSQEKGVHLIFEALERVSTDAAITLRVAGANDSEYCSSLRRKYPAQCGNASIEWLGWSEVEPLYNNTDVTIIPSAWMDNTPLSLIEALSYRVPVIATRIPPIEELVSDNENAFLADYLSVESLANAIERAIAHKKRIRSGRLAFPPITSVREYCRSVTDIYCSIASSSIHIAQCSLFDQALPRHHPTYSDNAKPNDDTRYTYQALLAPLQPIRS